MAREEWNREIFKFYGLGEDRPTIVEGAIVDGLYVPSIGLYGIKRFGESVWGPRPKDKIGFLRCLGENWSERRALVETLYWRNRKK